MSSNTKKVIKIEPKAGTVDFKETPPFALSYLSTYYNQPPTADETAVSKFLIEDFKIKKPSGTFLELGCGPTVHHIFPYAPYVSEIHMADYLDDNLEQVKIWKEGGPKAHDWRPYIGLTLRHEGKEITPESVNERQALSRKKLTKIFTCDLKGPTPPEYRGKYDCVGCFYCTEEIGISFEEWQKVVQRAADYIKPGGTLYMASLAEMNYYAVTNSEGVTADYPCAFINEEVIIKGLTGIGFSKNNIRMKMSEIDHPDCGVTGTLAVAADKS